MSRGRAASIARSYAVAALGVAAAALLNRTFLSPLTRTDSPLFLYLGAVLAAAAAGGVGPGMFATLLVLLVCVGPAVFFPRTAEPVMLARIVLFVAESALISILAQRHHRMLRSLYWTNERLRLLVEAAAEYAIFMLDRSGCIESWSAGAEALLGYRAQEIVGRPLAEIYPGRDAVGEARSDLAAAREKGCAGQEGWRRRADGLRFWAGIEVAMVRDVEGDLRGYMCLVRDLTERRRLDALAREHRAEIEAARVRSEFLAHISHEIRTPLNAILGTTRRLLARGLTAEQHEYAETARASGEALLSIVNDVLDFAKGESGEVEIEVFPFDLLQVIEETVDLMAFEADAKGVELVVHYPPEVPRRLCGDPGRIRQVLVNLAANAVKFSPGGRVTLGAESLERTDRNALIRIWVEDTGIGIAEDRLASIFNPFTQAGRTVFRQYGGTGLGLAISQQLAHLMGGSIQVQSREGAGSTFTMTLLLPLDPAGDPADEPAGPLAGRRALLALASPDYARSVAGTAAAGASRDGRSPRVLLAEDNSINQKLFHMALEEIGCAVDAVADGVEAVRMARLLPYDLVVLDCRMPRMDGYEAARRIRDLDAPAATAPIVAVTARAMPGERERCIAAGMNDCLFKPVREEALAEAVRRWVGGARAGGDPASSSPRAALGPDADFDAARLLDRLRGDAAVYRQIVDLFRKERAERARQMAEAVDARDGEALEGAAHALKGALMGLQAARAADAVRAIERCGPQPDWDMVPDAVARLNDELDRIDRDLDRVARA